MIESAYAVKPHPLSIVIFSKDRAAQLDLCLKSIYKNLSSLSEHWKIYVIYTASSEDFEDGYNQLIKEFYSKPNPIFFFPEKKYNGFKKTLEYCIKHWEDYVLFFTDDDIVYRNYEHTFDLLESEFKRDEDLLAVSLRLGCNTFIQDQYENKMCPIPDEVITDESLIRKWLWKHEPMDANFAYPFSLDGTIFPSRIAKKIIKMSPKYNNPNSLEGKVYGKIKSNLDSLESSMGCFEKSVVVNTPLNRVQETCANGAGKFFGSSPEELNKTFLGGNRLVLGGMDFSTIIGAHQELKLCWGEKCS